MNRSAEELRDMQGRFVLDFLTLCQAEGLPLDAEAAIDYFRSAWTLEFSIDPMRGGEGTS